MTTVNETKTKINGEWVSLVPDATTSSKGVVQVGDGLSVTNGIISTLGSKLLINKTSRTNTESFAVGTYSYTLPSASSGSKSGATSFSKVIADYSPTNPIRTKYNEFSITDSAMDYAIPAFSISFYAKNGLSTTVNHYLKVYRTSNSELLASVENNLTQYESTKTVEGTITLPQDWEWGTDTIYVDLSQSSSYSQVMSCSITAGTVTGTVYFSPTTT